MWIATDNGCIFGSSQTIAVNLDRRRR